MDPLEVAALQNHELDTMRKKMKKEGIKVSRQDIRNAVETVGHSTEAVEAHIRTIYKDL